MSGWFGGDEGAHASPATPAKLSHLSSCSRQEILGHLPPSSSTICFLFVIFAVSTIFHCHRRLALVPTPWAYAGRVVLFPVTPAGGGVFTINAHRAAWGTRWGVRHPVRPGQDERARRHPAPDAQHAGPHLPNHTPGSARRHGQERPWENYYLND